MTVETHKETLGFQAEVKQLLQLMAHSLYSNKEIFLRELISNASDAIDRLRFDALSNASFYEDDTDFKIRVDYDKDARTITVSDNGIGMSRSDVIANIGTIAKSGTHEFFQSLTGDRQKDASLIGQFGVGFYSSFVVADQVTLTTRKAGLNPEDSVRWESTGQGEYILEDFAKTTRGTEVVLHLREGADEFLNGFRLRTIIRTYSDHITIPIVMKVEEEGKDAEEVVNHASALWIRPKSEISEQEYTDFYKHLTHDFDEPLAYVHSRMEGTYEYVLLLYVPAHAPFDLWTREFHHGVKLYVRRVFIMDDAEKLMPRYLRYIRGIIDASDLPLNVSRELLQHSRLIETIRSTAVKKILGVLADLAAHEKEKYATFWAAFGAVLKEGLLEDSANREPIAKLFRFASTTSSSATQDVSLEEYVARMKEGQDKIYYLVAESFVAARDNPLLEIFKKKEVEVLLLSDPVDHLWVSELGEFNGIPLQSVSRGEVDLSKLAGGQETEEPPKSTAETDGLLVRIKAVLGEKVKDVRTTTRLTTSPACLVVDEYGIDPSLKRLLQAAGQTIPNARPILEINPDHPIINRMSNEADEKRFGDWAYLLLDQSALSSGEQLEDPIRFVNRLNDLLSSL